MFKARKITGSLLGGGAVLPSPPVKTGNPSISGTAQVGQVLTATHGTYTGTVTGYSGQWYSGAAAILGATGTTYTVQAGDTGSNITYQESAYNTNTSYSSATGTSNAIGPIINGGTTLLISTAPTIAGAAVVGQTLYDAGTDTYNATPDSSTDQWKVGGSAIGDGSDTSDAFLVLDSYAGSTITLSKIAHKSGYTDSPTNTSSATSAVTNIDLTNAITSTTRTSASGVTPMTVDIAFGSNVYAGYILDRIVYTDSALTVYKNGAEYNSLASHVLSNDDLQAGATIDWSADGGPSIAATDWVQYRVRTTSPNALGYQFTYGTAISPTDAVVPVTWNSGDKAAGVTLSGGGLDALANTGSYQMVRATTSKTTGKWYYEVKVEADPSFGMVGWANATASLNNYVGSDNNSVGYATNGVEFYGGANVGGGTLGGWSVNDIIQCCVDADADKVWFGRNNNYDTANNGNPATGTGGISVAAVGTYFPAFAALDVEVLAQFTAASQTYSPPTGFSAIGG